MTVPLQPSLDDVCPHCRVVVGDHTIRGWAECLDARGFNLDMPYTEFEGGPLKIPAMGDRIPVGAINMKAGTIDSHALGVLPIVIFSFTGTGAMPMQRVETPEYALVLDKQGMRGAKELAVRIFDQAIKAAG